MNENPTEIITIIIEDYVHSPKGLTKVFTEAGLDKYWYPVSKMPRKGEDWPTINDMVKLNHRLLVFTSDSSKEAFEGIAYQWRYMVENERKYSMLTHNFLCIFFFFFLFNFCLCCTASSNLLLFQLEMVASYLVRVQIERNQSHSTQKVSLCFYKITSQQFQIKTRLVKNIQLHWLT